MHFFYFFAFAIIILIPGLIFLIIGLINKKKKLWIPGSIGILISIILFFIGVYQTILLTTTIMEQTYKQSKKNMLFTDSLINNTNTQYNSYNFDIKEAEQYPVFMLDNGKRYFFHLYLNKNLKEKMNILEVKEKDISRDPENEIQMMMQFESDFKGKLHLICYNNDELEIYKSNTRFLNIKEEENISVSFPINKDFNLQKIEYCLIK